MKKFLKILLFTVLVILAILFTAPFLFKGKIISIANEQLKNNLNANASFSDVSISLFRNFPNLSIQLDDLAIVGIDNFEGDTLLYLYKLNIAVDVISAIKMENIEVKQITLDKPTINAIVLKDGTSNWDIVPESDAIEEEADTSSSDFSAQINLKLFSITEGDISYKDYSSNMSAELQNFNFSLTGDLSQDFSSLIIDSETEHLYFTMDGIPYLKNTLLKMHFDVDANLAESIYKLNENSISLNALSLSFDGSIAMPESGDIITELKFSTNSPEFKTLLSLVPAIYLTDFPDLKTKGTLKLTGEISGAVTDNTTPDVDVNLLVKDASFSYPDLPKTAEDIQIDVDVHYDGKQMDNTVVDINRFHVNMGGNPIDMVLNIRTPESDPFVNGKLNASLDLASITDIIPLENTELKGLIKAQLDWMGKLSSIENEKYEDFKADGSVSISNLTYNSPDVPNAVQIKNSLIAFSPKYVEISKFDASLGSSNFSINGRVTNFIPYVLDNKTIKGELNLNSTHINLNELMSSTEEETAATSTDTAQIEVVEIPDNIDFRFSSYIAKLRYDKMDIDNLRGNIFIKEGKVVLENLSMNTLEGTLAISGEYNTQDIRNPLVDLEINADQIDIPKAFTTFDVLGKIAPIASSASGKISLGMSFSSLLTQNMKPVIKSISGDGRLASNQIGIKNATTFTAISKALKTDALNNLTLNNVDLKYTIQNGSLQVEPFETNMGKLKMLIGGEQSFENALNYKINLQAPRELLGLENPVVNNLYSQAASGGLDISRSETVSMLIDVTGAISDPQVKLNLKESASDAVENVKEEIKQTATKAVKEKTEEIKEDTKEKARAEADKIMLEAEKQAETIRKEAKKSADAVRWEANNNAKKLVDEAKNPLAKAAAETAAKKLRSEGESKAQKIEKEADEKANKVTQEARKKADDLLK